MPATSACLRDLDRLYAEVAAAGKGLDIVVANAGSTRVARLGDISDDDLDALLTTNVKGVVYTVQKALPLLNDGASIILVGSTTADRGRPGLSIYAASKAAVRSLARGWANELADRGIRVNVLVAGSTATPGSDNLAAQTDARLLGRGIPRRSGRDHSARALRRSVEIANAAVFLASDLASFSTGSTDHRRRRLQPGLILLREQIHHAGEHRRHGRQRLARCATGPDHRRWLEATPRSASGSAESVGATAGRTLRAGRRVHSPPSASAAPKARPRPSPVSAST